MDYKTGEPIGALLTALGGVAIHLYICVNERPHEPWPDGALMIGGVARMLIAGVAPDIVRVSTGKCAQADGSKQFTLHGGNHLLGALGREHAVRQTDSEDLVRTHRRICVRTAHDVIKAV